MMFSRTERVKTNAERCIYGQQCLDEISPKATIFVASQGVLVLSVLRATRGMLGLWILWVQ